MDHNEQNPFGSAREPSEEEMIKAGMADAQAGPYLMRSRYGFDAYTQTDGGVYLAGGQGAFKTSGYFLPAIIKAMRDLDMGGLGTDPRGEISATLPLACSVFGYSLYTINFGRFAWSPEHKTNVWDHLTPDNPTLVGDCIEAMQDAIPL